MITEIVGMFRRFYTFNTIVQKRAGESDCWHYKDAMSSNASVRKSSNSGVLIQGMISYLTALRASLFSLVLWFWSNSTS
jgi:hypothetical protein